MSGTPKIPGPNYSLDIGGDPGKPPIESEITIEPLDVTSTINIPDPIVTQSSTKMTVKVPTGAKTGPIHLHTNGIGANSATFTVN